MLRTGTPVIIAACSLPPIAKMCRPHFVQRKAKPKSSAKTNRKIAGFGIDEVHARAT